MPIDLVLTRIRIENYLIHNLFPLSCSAGYLSTGLSTRHRYCTIGVQYRLWGYPIAESRFTAMSAGLTPVFKNIWAQRPTTNIQLQLLKEMQRSLESLLGRWLLDVGRWTLKSPWLLTPSCRAEFDEVWDEV